MNEQKNHWLNIAHAIDTINIWIAKIFCFLFIPITAFAVYEVFMRYVVNKPTIWVWDVNTQLMAVITMLAIGYTLLRGGHINIELLTERLSQRGKKITEAIISPVLLLVFIVLIWQIGTEASDSVRNNEIAVTFFAPPLYPVKIVMAVGAFLLLIQGISQFIKAVVDIRKMK